MADVRSNRVEQPDSPSQNQAASALHEQMNQWRDEAAEQDQLAKLTKKGENGRLTGEERVQFAALNSFPGNKEAQSLVIAEQTNKLTTEQSYELNAWRRFGALQQTRERELCVKGYKHELTKEEEGEFLARTSFPGNKRAIELFVKQNSGKTMSEKEQQELTELLRSKAPTPPSAPPTPLERRDNQPPPAINQTLEFTNPYPYPTKPDSRLTEVEQRQADTALLGLTLMKENQTMFGADSGPLTPETNSSRALPIEGQPVAGAAAGLAQGQPDYTVRLLEIYPNDPVIVRLFNQYLLGKIVKDSSDYITLMNELQRYAGRR